MSEPQRYSQGVTDTLSSSLSARASFLLALIRKACLPLTPSPQSTARIRSYSVGTASFGSTVTNTSRASLLALALSRICILPGLDSDPYVYYCSNACHRAAPETTPGTGSELKGREACGGASAMYITSSSGSS